MEVMVLTLLTYPYSWTKQLEDVFRAKAKERMLSGNPVLKSEQGRAIEMI